MKIRRSAVYHIEELRGILAKHYTKEFSKKEVMQEVISGKRKIPNIAEMTFDQLVSVCMDEKIAWDKRLSVDAILVYHPTKDSYMSLWERGDGEERQEAPVLDQEAPKTETQKAPDRKPETSHSF